MDAIAEDPDFEKVASFIINRNVEKAHWPTLKRSFKSIITKIDCHLNPRKRSRSLTQSVPTSLSSRSSSPQTDRSIPRLSEAPTSYIAFESISGGKIPGLLIDQGTQDGYLHFETDSPMFNHAKASTRIPTTMLGFGHTVETLTEGDGPVYLEIRDKDDSDGSECTSIPNMVDPASTWAMPTETDPEAWAYALTALMQSLNNVEMDCYTYDGVEPMLRDAIGVSKQSLSSDSRLQRTQTTCIGMHTPYIYLTPKSSLLPIQMEHAGLSSVHLLHAGCSKVTVVIRPSHSQRFEALFDAQHTTCSQWIRHMSFIPSPALLEQHGIEYTIVVQHPGDVLYIASNTYHFSLNTGPNCLETVNICPHSEWHMPEHYKYCTEDCGAEAVVRDDLMIAVPQSPLFCSESENTSSPGPGFGLSPSPSIIPPTNIGSEDIQFDGSPMVLVHRPTPTTETPNLAFPTSASTQAQAQTENMSVPSMSGVQASPASSEVSSCESTNEPPVSGRRAWSYSPQDPGTVELWKSCLKRSAEAAQFNSAQVRGILEMWDQRPLSKSLEYVVRSIQLVCEIAAPQTLKILKAALVDSQCLQPLHLSQSVISPMDDLVQRCALVDTMRTTRTVSDLYTQRLLLLQIWQDFKSVNILEGNVFALENLQDAEVLGQQGFKKAIQELKIHTRYAEKANKVESNLKKYLFAGRTLSQYLNGLNPMLLLLFPGYIEQPLLLRLLDPPEGFECLGKPFNRQDRILHFKAANNLAGTLVKYIGQHIRTIHPYLSDLNLTAYYASLEDPDRPTNMALLRSTDEEIEDAWRCQTISRLFV